VKLQKTSVQATFTLYRASENRGLVNLSGRLFGFHGSARFLTAYLYIINLLTICQVNSVNILVELNINYTMLIAPLNSVVVLTA